jgi:hypothetical protein
MVARVDMRVDDALQSDFELHEVHLYNRYAHGRVVPNSGVMAGTKNTLKVNAPTIPAGEQPTINPIKNDFYETDGGNLQSITRSIYLMENAPINDRQKATCFVVGGKYLNSGKIRYWRVDIPKYNGGDFSDGFRVFLRNNCYEVIIKAVNSEGFDTPEEAFILTERGEVVLDVTSWEPVDILFADNGNPGGTIYTLKASPASLHYLRKGTDGTPGSFSISTSYDGGWTGVLEGEGNWLHIDNPTFSGAKNEIKNYTFTIDPTANGEFHHAYLKITAGSLVKYIDIYQSDVANGSTDVFYDWTESEQSSNTTNGPYRLGISTTRIDMYMAKSAQSSFLITTDYPKGYTTRIINGADWLTINSNGSSTAPVTGQALTFTVADNPIALPREAIIEVTAGNLIKRIRIVQHMDNDILTGMEDWEPNGKDEPLDGPYSLTLSKQDIVCPEDVFTVSMNVTASASAGVQWTTSTANDWITNLTASGAANGTAQPLSFTLTANTTGAIRNGIVTVSIIHRGNKLTQDIHVRQYPGSDPVIRVVVNNLYKTDQLVAQSFKLYSKMDWAVRLKSGGDPAGIFRTLYTTGGKANQNGTDIRFALKTVATNIPRTVTLEIFSPTGEFNTKEVVLTAKN